MSRGREGIEWEPAATIQEDRMAQTTLSPEQADALIAARLGEQPVQMDSDAGMETVPVLTVPVAIT